ncbi:MAG: PAS domain-containing protein, partial [Verrucomicrobiota bacterium]
MTAPTDSDGPDIAGRRIKHPRPADPAGLRQKAEERVKHRHAANPPQDEADLRRLQQELEIHQAELELQNEELLETQAELETSLERYTDFYDFAPVGYLALGRDGEIRQLNPSAAKLLGAERSDLVTRRLGQFVCEADRAALAAFLDRVFASEQPEVCEVSLMEGAELPSAVRLKAVCAPSGQECR